LLLLSDIIITLNKSADYSKLTLLIYVGAIWVLWLSALPLIISSLITLILLIVLLQLWRGAIAFPPFTQVSYQAGYWRLQGSDGQEYKFEQAFISFEGGLFFLLTFTGYSARKTIVIFSDQITTSQTRHLWLLRRLQPHDNTSAMEKRRFFPRPQK